MDGSTNAFRGDTVDGISIRRENELRLVVEIPFTTGFKNIPGGFLAGFQPSTVIL